MSHDLAVRPGPAPADDAAAAEFRRLYADAPQQPAPAPIAAFDIDPTV